MKAIMADKLASGAFYIPPEAEPEDWEEVRDYAASIRYVGATAQLAPYRHAVCVVDEDQSEQFYLIDTDEVTDTLLRPT